MPALTVIGSGTNGVNDGADVAFTFAAGVLPDDLVILYGGRDGRTPVTPSGYTLLVTQNFLKVFYKFMGSTPDTGVTWRGSGVATDAQAAGYFIVRGADFVTPFDVTSTVAGASSTNPDPASITTVTANALVIAIAAQQVDTGISAGPAGYSGFQVFGTLDTARIRAAGAYKLLGAAGAEDPGVFTSASAVAWNTITLAIRRAGDKPMPSVVGASGAAHRAASW